MTKTGGANQHPEEKNLFTIQLCAVHDKDGEPLSKLI